MGFWIFVAIIAILFFGSVVEVLLMLFPSDNTCDRGRDKHHWMRNAIDDHR